MQPQRNETRTFLAEVTEAARHSLSLAKDCIAARLREACISEEPNPIRMIQQAVSNVFGNDGTRVELFITERLWPIKGEISLIFECIELVAERAARVSPADRKVRISGVNYEAAERIELSHSSLNPGRYVEISVNNGGPAVSSTVLLSILDLKTALALGAGLELSLASSVLDYFGGGLSITSTFTEGTTVRLHIPESRDGMLPAPRMASPFAAAAKPRSGKVLVLDDEDKIRVLLRRMLTHLNAEVALAEDGAEALELFQGAISAGDPFDVVILDLTIPGGMGGREAIAEMVKMDPHVKGIVSSGYSQDPVMANYREHHFCAVMAKPYSFAQLKETVSPYLKNP